MSVEKDPEDNSFFNGNDAWPRKFSHINKLAKGLALNMMEDIPFQLAGNENIPLRPSASHKLKSLKLKRNTSNMNAPMSVPHKGMLR